MQITKLTANVPAAMSSPTDRDSEHTGEVTKNTNGKRLLVGVSFVKKH